MQMRWNDAQLEIRSRFAKFGEKVSERALANRCEQFDAQSWQELVDEDFFGLAVPKQFGGSGLSWWEFVAAFEGISTTANDLGFLLSIIAHMGAIRIISERGSAHQKETFLPGLVGGAIAATAATEEFGGSDVSRVRTSATFDPSGALCVTGTKTHITNAPIAHVFVIVGRLKELDPKRDITLFLLERKQGVLTTEPEDTFGNRSSPTGDIRLDSVPVTSEDMIGIPGDGLAALYTMLTLDRLLYAITAAGYLEFKIERAFRHAYEREAFGQRLCDHQYIQDKLVRLKVSMEQARYLAYAALDHLLADSNESSSLGSIAKLVGTEALFASSYEYLQLFGHTGYMTGDASRFVCDAIGTRIAGGTSEMQKVNIYKQIQRRFVERSGHEHRDVTEHPHSLNSRLERHGAS